MNARAVVWLQAEAAHLYRLARDYAEASPVFALELQQSAAALSFAARVLGYVELPF